MEEKKFTYKTEDELLQLTSDELEEYTYFLELEIEKLKKEIKKTNAGILKDQLETKSMKSQIKELQNENIELIKKHGWDGITEEELTWLMKGGLEKHWPQNSAKYFRADFPSLREIREKYQEEQGVAKRDFTELEKKLVNSSGWIDRAGKYYAVAFAEHDKFAREFLIKKYGREKAYAYRETDHGKLPFFEVLERKFKWVRIMAWPGVETEFVLPKDLTHAQKQTLYKYCEFHLKKLPFEDELFHD